MFVRSLMTLAILLALFASFVALQPADFRITRSTVVDAPPQAVFELVNDLHRWEAWSPWAKLDPAAVKSYEGPPAGLGAASTWSGNDEIGEGRMMITQSRPFELVQLSLEFKRPMQATDAAELVFTPEGAHTRITWSMYGKRNFVAKAFGLFMNVDKMVGGQFETGLRQLKTLAESAPKS